MFSDFFKQNIFHVPSRDQYSSVWLICYYLAKILLQQSQLIRNVETTLLQRYLNVRNVIWTLKGRHVPVGIYVGLDWHYLVI